MGEELGEGCGAKNEVPRMTSILWRFRYVLFALIFLTIGTMLTPYINPRGYYIHAVVTGVNDHPDNLMGLIHGKYLLLFNPSPYSAWSQCYHGIGEHLVIGSKVPGMFGGGSVSANATLFKDTGNEHYVQWDGC